MELVGRLQKDFYLLGVVSIEMRGNTHYSLLDLTRQASVAESRVKAMLKIKYEFYHRQLIIEHCAIVIRKQEDIYISKLGSSESQKYE